MLKKIIVAILVVTVVVVVSVTLQNSDKKADAVSWCGFPAPVSGQIADIVSSNSPAAFFDTKIAEPFDRGQSYMLLTNGAVYGEPCAPYFGGANGQGYFAGKVAKTLKLYCGTGTVQQGGGTIKGYVIVNTADQTYHYGNTTNNVRHCG